MEGDTKLSPRPTETPLVDGKGFQNLGFGASLDTFCAHRKYPAGGTDKPIQNPIPRQKEKIPDNFQISRQILPRFAPLFRYTEEKSGKRERYT